MTLNHPCGASIRVEVFWDNAMWTDVTDDIRGLSIQTDRRTPLTNIFEPGRLVMQVTNRSRTYDPTNASGPHFGNLKPGRLVRAFINNNDVWWGFVDRFAMEYTAHNIDATTTITCITPLAFTGMQVVPAGQTPALTEGEAVAGRADAIVSLAANGTNVGGASWTDLPQYTARCSGADRWDRTRDRNVRDELAKLGALEQGPVISAQTENSVILYPRHWFKLNPKSIVAQATFSQGVGVLPIYDASVRFDADEIITAVSMTDEIGNAVVSIDTAGESEYGTRYPASSFSDLPALNDEDLEGAANTVVRLRATETFRIESLTVKPARSAALAAALDNLDLLTRVQASWSPPGGGALISGDYFIDGITHQITREDWTTTYSLWSCAPFDAAMPGAWFLVDSSLVDGSDVVGL